MLNWTHSGVDFSLYGNGGHECVQYLSERHKIAETVFIVTYAALFEIGLPWKKFVADYKPNLELRERFGRKLLLASLCLIW